MALPPEIAGFVGMPYCRHNGPHQLDTIDPWTDGINCQLLAHLVLHHLTGALLPRQLLSRELFLDRFLFDVVASPKSAAVGDILLFGKSGEQDYRRLHVAVLIDSALEGDPPCIHATSIEGSVCLWPISKFSHHKQYEKLFAIKRLKGAE